MRQPSIYRGGRRCCRGVVRRATSGNEVVPLEPRAGPPSKQSQGFMRPSRRAALGEAEPCLDFRDVVGRAARPRGSSDSSPRLSPRFPVAARLRGGKGVRPQGARQREARRQDRGPLRLVRRDTAPCGVAIAAAARSSRAVESGACSTGSRPLNHSAARRGSARRRAFKTGVSELLMRVAKRKRRLRQHTRMAQEAGAVESAKR